MPAYTNKRFVLNLGRGGPVTIFSEFPFLPQKEYKECSTGYFVEMCVFIFKVCVTRGRLAPPVLFRPLCFSGFDCAHVRPQRGKASTGGTITFTQHTPHTRWKQQRLTSNTLYNTVSNSDFIRSMTSCAHSFVMNEGSRFLILLRTSTSGGPAEVRRRGCMLRSWSLVAVYRLPLRLIAFRYIKAVAYTT